MNRPNCELTPAIHLVRDVGGKKGGRIMKISERGTKEWLKEAVDLISRDVTEIDVCLLEFLCVYMCPLRWICCRTSGVICSIDSN